jgi:hypothetical protein
MMAVRKAKGGDVAAVVGAAGPSHRAAKAVPAAEFAGSCCCWYFFFLILLN